MNLRFLFSRSVRKKFRLGAVLYGGLSMLSSLFYCSCSSGSFYVLNTGQYMLEHSMDRQFVISSEYKTPAETGPYYGVPVYKEDEKYYVAANRMDMRRNVGVFSSVGQAAPEPYYHTSKEEKAYYEVELTVRSGEFFFSLPSAESKDPQPAFTTMPVDSPVITANFLPSPSYPSVSLAMEACRQVPTYTCEQTGDIQLRLTEPEEQLSWRALYGLPSAAVLFVAVDIPFDLISFTGFCIGSLFD